MELEDVIIWKSIAISEVEEWDNVDYEWEEDEE